MSDVRDIAINLAASVIAGAAVWISQFLLRYRRLVRQRAFFGVQPHAEVLLSVSRHFSSPQPHSVHRWDVATLVELATVVKQCGGRPTLVTANEIRQEAGRVTEYCVGGPTTNPRAAAFLRSALPDVHFLDPQGTDDHGIQVGAHIYRMVHQHEEYVLLARILHPATARPVFLLTGQTALSNLAAARYLTAHQRTLRGRRDFCLLLRVHESPVFGADHAELVADCTDHACRPQPRSTRPPHYPWPRPKPRRCQRATPRRSQQRHRSSPPTSGSPDSSDMPRRPICLEHSHV